MSSRGLLAMGKPAGPFLSTYISTSSTSNISNISTYISTSNISTSSTSHILNSNAFFSHTSPLALPPPLEVEVEVPWGKVAGLQWRIQQTNSDQEQVAMASNKTDF